MALTFHDGFEAGGTDAWDASSGAISVSGLSPRTGNYRLLSGNTGYVTKNVASAPNRINLSIRPSASLSTAADILWAAGGDKVTLNTDDTLTLDVNGSTDTSTETVVTSGHQRLCLATNGSTTKLYMDGVEICSVAQGADFASSVSIGQSSNSSTTINMDDVSFDDTSSTDDLGDIRVLAARPVAEGTDQDTGTGSDWQDSDNTPAVYTEIDQDPPNITDYNWAEADGVAQYYSVGLDDCGSGNLSGIGGSDTIEAVNFLYYYETAGGGSVDEYNIYGRDASGRSGMTALDDPKDPTWVAEYETSTWEATPTAWSQALFNAQQMGMMCQDANKDMWFYEAYAMVAFKVAAGAASLSISVFDSIGVSDTPILEIPILVINTFDSVGITDVVDISIPILLVNVFDSVQVIEAVTIEIAVEPIVLINVFDSIAVTDAVDLALDLYEINVFDSIAVTDAVDLALDLYEINVFDSIAVTDAITLSVPVLVISVFDSITVTDVETVQLTGADVLAIDVFDSVGVTDASTVALNLYLVSVFDSITLTDFENVEVPFLAISVYDDISLTDFAHQGQMSIAGTFFDVDLDDSGWVDVLRDVVHIAGLSGDSFFTLDSSTISAITERDQIGPDAVNLNGIEYVETDGKHTFITTIYSDAIHMVDVEDPDNISIVSTVIDGPGENDRLTGAAGTVIVRNIWGRARVAFICAFQGQRLSAYDISDSLNPTWITTYGPDADINGIISCGYHDGYIFAACRWSKRITSFDVSVTDTISLGQHLTDDVTKRFERLAGVIVVNGKAYACSSPSLPTSEKQCFNIINVDAPEGMYIEGYVADADILSGAYVPDIINDNWAIATGRYRHTLVLIDISDKTDPVIVDWLRDETNLNGADDTMWKYDNAWVTLTDGAGLAVVNIPQVEGLIKHIDIYSDNIGVTDYVNVNIPFVNVNVFDSIGVTDSETVEVPFLAIKVFDTIEISDVVELSIPVLLASVFDSIGVSDALNIQAVGAGILNIDVFDSITVTEAIDLALDLYEINVYDSIAVTDAVDISIPILLIAAYDEVAATDAVDISIPILLAYVYDSITVTDAVDISIPILLVNVFDSIVVTEDVTPLVVVPWYLPTDITVTTSIQSGTLVDTYSNNGVELIVNEEVGTPGSEIELEFGEFEAVPDTDLVIDLAAWYDGNPAHITKLQQWDYNALDWTDVTTDAIDFPSTASKQDYHFVLINDPDYISAGKIRLKIAHTSAGNPTHNFYIDLALLGDAANELEVEVFDSIGLSDAISAALNLYEINVFETIGLSDTFNAQLLGAGILNVDVFDSITVIESVNLALNLYEIDVFDLVQVTDVTTTLLDVLLINTYDDIIVSDEISAALDHYEVSVFDSIQVTDTIIIESEAAAKLYISVYDSITVTDVADVSIPVLRIEVYDSIEVSDTTIIEAEVADQLYVSVYDDVIVTDYSNTAFDKFLISVGDDIQVTDYLLTQLPVFHISVFDNIQLEDYTEWVNGTVFFINVYDTIGLTDSVVVTVTDREIADYLLDSPAAIMQAYLAYIGKMSLPSDSQSWPVYLTHLPDGMNVENNAGAVDDHSPTLDGRHMAGQTIAHHSVQLRIRSVDYKTGWAKINDITDTLDDVTQELFIKGGANAYLIENISRSGVNYLGAEAGTKRRHMFLEDFLLTLRPS